MIRRHPITGEPILLAPARAGRPHAFGDASEERCPFCPGNERDTPPELKRIGDPWRVRVFPNKFPPVEGAEVIVESPEHEASFDQITHAREVVAAYVDRYRTHAASPYVALFKNEGARAGASIPHVHSQVIPLPFTPPRIAEEMAAFRKASRCPLCAGIEAGVIGESDAFSWLAPAGSKLPWQQWIVPKRHAGEITALHDVELEELAAMLARAARATRSVAHSYNWAFMNFPGAPEGHTYIDVMPRVTGIAGLELGSGTFVEIIDPAAAAERLRG
jgi:UDPglucose--hexose-1-phosphate uridylyltransferase